MNIIRLCLFLFIVFYLPNVESNERLFEKHDSNNTNNSRDGFIVKKRNSYFPNLVQHGRDITMNATSTMSSIINVTDYGHTVQSQVNSTHSLLTRNRSKLALITTNQPLHRRTLVYNDSYVSRYTKKDLRILNTSSTIAFDHYKYFSKCPVNDQYDSFVGTIYWCDSDEECKQVLEKSKCLTTSESPETYKCGCIPNYVYDGEKCVRQDTLYFCSSHDDCRVLKKSSCSCLASTGVKFCKCPWSYITTKHECLRKDPGYIKDKNQWVYTLPFTAIAVTCVFILRWTILFILRRLYQRRRYTRANNSPNPSIESLETGTTNPPSDSSSLPDLPPVYDVVMASTTTITDAGGTTEDTPPSYEDCKKSCYNK